MPNICDTFSDMALHNGRYEKHAEYNINMPYINVRRTDFTGLPNNKP